MDIFDKKELIYKLKKDNSFLNKNLYICIDEEFCLDETVDKKGKVRHTTIFLKKDLEILLTYLKTNNYNII
ncbi:MAG: hypothetical protein RSE41_02455 [Clostridia bacterium]